MFDRSVTLPDNEVVFLDPLLEVLKDPADLQLNLVAAGKNAANVIEYLFANQKSKD